MFGFGSGSEQFPILRFGFGSEQFWILGYGFAGSVRFGGKIKGSGSVLDTNPGSIYKVYRVYTFGGCILYIGYFI